MLFNLQHVCTFAESVFFVDNTQHAIFSFHLSRRTEMQSAFSTFGYVHVWHNIQPISTFSSVHVLTIPVERSTRMLRCAGGHLDSQMSINRKLWYTPLVDEAILLWLTLNRNVIYTDIRSYVVTTSGGNKLVHESYFMQTFHPSVRLYDNSWTIQRFGVVFRWVRIWRKYTKVIANPTMNLELHKCERY